MLSSVLENLQLDCWEQEVIAYIVVTGDQEIYQSCSADLQTKISAAQAQLKLLPKTWAYELCQQTLA